MNERGWEELVDLIDQKFIIAAHNKFEEVLEDNHKLKRTIDRIEFEKAGDSYRIDRVTAPMIVERKTFYHRSGTQNHAQNVYDPDETSSRVFFLKQVGSEWIEVKAEQLFSQ